MASGPDAEDEERLTTRVDGEDVRLLVHIERVGAREPRPGAGPDRDDPAERSTPPEPTADDIDS